MKTPPLKRRTFQQLGALALLSPWQRAFATDNVAAVASEAYVWGYPMVDMYAILHGQVLDPQSAEYKAPFNAVGHARTVATPDDKAVIAPNVDTPYSHAWLDLRGGPILVFYQQQEPQRYVSLQLFDLYTWIIDYVTPRTNGNAGGDFLVTPPGWTGPVPPGIRKVFPSTTLLALGMFRTQLLGADDLPKVHAIQDKMRVRTLPEYLGQAPVAAAALPALVAPLNLRQKPTDPAFFDVLNWMLNFMPVLDDERDLRQRLQAFGVAPGQIFTGRNPADLPQVMQGMGAALKAMGERARQVRSSAELFGSRAFLKQDYLIRAVGAMLGILGNAAEEYLGVGYQADGTGQPFGGQHRYRIRFAPGQLPPVDAFWSITVYTQAKLLYANAIQRYVINSVSLPGLVKDADGGFTLYVQNVSPGAALQANWLPVPAGVFGLTFRTYLPRAEIREGRWRAPAVVRAEAAS